jgi:uncharacterized membrane protein
VYLLLVLRAVRGDAAAGEVPEAAVAVGSLLGLISVLALLVFINGVATLMVADEVVRRVRREFDAAINKLPIAPQDTCSTDLPDDFEHRAGAIPLPREGYVQSVDYGKIIEWADERDSIVRLKFRPGDFVVDGDHKVAIYPAPADPVQARKEIGRFIVSGDQRTPTQDLEFATRHLVEVAVRALSPGINDPFTALAVIDRLRGGLVRLCQHHLPAKNVAASSGKLRLVRDETTFAGLVDTAFRQIRQAGAAKPAVLVRMLEAIGGIGEHVRTVEQRESLEHHARLVRAAGEREVTEPADLEDVERAFQKATSTLNGSSRHR